MNIIKLYFLFVLIISSLYSVEAHPWRTASDWCHYCRTNCDSWWVGWNVRHCHWWTSTTTSSSNSYNSYDSSKTIINCPTNSTYNSIEKSCTCNNGFAPSFNNSYCIKIPENAHAVINSNTDIWLCNEWYEEVWNTCRKITTNNNESIENQEKELIKTDNNINWNIYKKETENNTESIKNINSSNNSSSKTNEYIEDETSYWFIYLLIALGWFYFYKKNKKNTN